MAMKDVVIINVESITDITQLHILLKKELNFPEFYGMNWDAFWDAITGLVELPNVINFKGWKCLEYSLPEDSRILENMFTLGFYSITNGNDYIKIIVINMICFSV